MNQKHGHVKTVKSVTALCHTRPGTAEWKGGGGGAGGHMLPQYF